MSASDKGYDSEEESSKHPVFINLGNDLRITGSHVIIQIDDSDKAHVHCLSTVTPISTSNSSESLSSYSVRSPPDEHIYMEMSSVRKSLPRSSMGNISCDSQGFFSSDERRYSKSSSSYVDGLASVRQSDIDPEAQCPRRISLPIPQRLMHEAAQNAFGFVDVDVTNKGISGALQQVTSFFFTNCNSENCGSSKLNSHAVYSFRTKPLHEILLVLFKILLQILLFCIFG